jgi:queuine tRNA-ribosyltransferase
MLAPMLASVHNLHFYVSLMRDVRATIEAGAFAAFAAAFRADRARGI